MSDERRPGSPASPDEAAGAADDARQDPGDPAENGAVSPGVGGGDPAFDAGPGATVPIVPRKLPTAAEFFGEPRAPRHAAPEREDVVSDGVGSEAAAQAPAVSEPEPEQEPVSEPVSLATSPHPQALDLSALRGQRVDDDDDEAPIVPPASWSLTGEQPTLDSAALPAHDGQGEVPTAAFGAVFGATPTAPVEQVPPSFTELLAVPPASVPDSSAPTSFNWADLPEPVVGGVEPEGQADAEPDSMTEPEPDTMTEPEPASMTEPEPASMTEPEPASMTEPEVQAESQSASWSDVQPKTAAFEPVVPADAPPVPESESEPVTAPVSGAEIPEPQPGPEPERLDAEGAGGDGVGASRAEDPFADSPTGGAAEAGPGQAGNADAASPETPAPWWLSERLAAAADRQGAGEQGEGEPVADPTFTELLGVVPAPGASAQDPAVDSAEQDPAPDSSAPVPALGSAEQEAAPGTFGESAGSWSLTGPVEPPAPASAGGAAAVAPAPGEPADMSRAGEESGSDSTAEPRWAPAPESAAPSEPGGAAPVRPEPEPEPGAKAASHAGRAPEPGAEAAPFAGAESAAGVERAPETGEPEPETEAELDPVSLLFGEIVEVTGPVELPAGDAEEPEREVDSAWADAPRDPALDDDAGDGLPATVAFTPPFAVADPDATRALPVSSVEPEPAPSQEPATAAFAAPTSAAPTSAAPADVTRVGAAPTPAPGTTPAPTTTPPASAAPTPARGGASSRSVTPIDLADVPASWATAAPAAAPAARPDDSGHGTGGGGTTGGGGLSTWPRERKILLAVGVVVAFVVVLAALFFFGRTIADGATAPVAAPVATATTGASPKPSSTPTSTPTPSPSATAASGPASPGVHQWSDLRGGECLSSFTNAWQQSYTVVDCGSAHAGQLVATGEAAGATGSTYPGQAALQAEVSPKCQSSDVINIAAAQAYTGVVVSASYPATAEEWAAGSRTYYCFVSRTGGQTLTSSLAAG